jgi:hypothetical protein
MLLTPSVNAFSYFIKYTGLSWICVITDGLLRGLEYFFSIYIPEAQIAGPQESSDEYKVVWGGRNWHLISTNDFGNINFLINLIQYFIYIYSLSTLLPYQCQEITRFAILNDLLANFIFLMRSEIYVSVTLGANLQLVLLFFSNKFIVIVRPEKIIICERRH